MKDYIKSAVPVRYHLAIRKLVWSLRTAPRRLRGEAVFFGESSKARARRQREGFFDKYCQGKGLDIGHGGDLLCPNARGWDFEDGDAQALKGLRDGEFDFVYASHVLEHMVDCQTTLRNWWRVLRPGGHLILSVPHRELYEKKKTLPSRWNPDHKHFFLPEKNEAPDTLGLRELLSESLSGFELCYLKECRDGHTITDPLVHSDGEFSIEAVLRKPTR